jgi:hypothetical protein
MTVAELIARLKEYPPDRHVYIDTGYSASAACRTGTIYTSFISPGHNQHFPDDYASLYEGPTDAFSSPVVMISL